MPMHKLPLEEHFSELRRRLLYCLLPAACILCFLLWRSGLLLQYLFAPLTQLGIPVCAYQVTDGLLLRLRLALTVDLLLLFPLLLWQGYAFARPGLYASERRKLLSFLIPDTVAFYAAYYCFIKLTPALVKGWYTAQQMPVIVSAHRYLVLWQTAALIVSGCIAVVPAGILLLRLLRGRQKQKTK